MGNAHTTGSRINQIFAVLKLSKQTNKLGLKFPAPKQRQPTNEDESGVMRVTSSAKATTKATPTATATIIAQHIKRMGLQNKKKTIIDDI